MNRIAIERRVVRQCGTPTIDETYRIEAESDSDTVASLGSDSCCILAQIEARDKTRKAE